MGSYLNPSNANFLEILRMPIFVDKTPILSVINRFIDQCNKYICVARPRRFGKTIAANIISAYYSKGCDSRAVFEKFKIAKDVSFESNLNKFNVIKIDLNAEYETCRKKECVLENLQDKVITEFQEQFPNIKIKDYMSIAEAMQTVYEETGEQFVILIDEYDVFVREQVKGKISDNLFDEYLGFLNGLFKNDTLKPAIALAYLTGILPIVRDKIQYDGSRHASLKALRPPFSRFEVNRESKLNVFEEYTMLEARNLTEFVGFTENEVLDLCNEYKIDFDECKRWYNGYRLTQKKVDVQNNVKEVFYDIYNPRSLILSIEKREFGNYWSSTSTYQVITEKLNLNFDGTKDAVVQMLGGESVDVDADSFLNTMTDFHNLNDVFTYLIHLGYLVYNRKQKTCRIPNGEIRSEWQRAVNDNEEYKVTNGIIKHSKELLELTFEGDEKAVAAALDTAHIHVTSNRSYNNEDALQSAIYLSYMYALNKYTIVREMTAGKGFADVTFVPYVPNVPAMIVELKHNKDERSAINQIKEKKYFESLAHYKGDLLFIGINYDEDTKTHTCKIEKFVK